MYKNIRYVFRIGERQRQNQHTATYTQNGERVNVEPVRQIWICYNYL